MPHRARLEKDFRDLVQRGRGVAQLEGRPDVWIIEQYPALAALARTLDADAAIGELIARLVEIGLGRLDSPKRAEIIAEYLGMPGGVGRLHKQRQWEARVALGDLERGSEWSQSNFRQHIAPKLRSELIEAMQGSAGPSGDATPTKGPRSATHPSIEWPLDDHRPGKGQDIVVLAATPTMREGPGSPLIRIVRELEPYFVRERPMIYALDGSCSAILRCGVLHDYEWLVRLPAGVEGGLVYATEIVLAAKDAGHNSTVVYLIDPRDPSSRYPAALALKRACVLQQVPCLTSRPSALRWFRPRWAVSTLEADETMPWELRQHLLLTPRESAVVLGAGGDEAIALGAHDRYKLAMLNFVAQHQDFLSQRYVKRYATEITGRLLNGDPIDDEIKQSFGRYAASHDEQELDLARAESWQVDQARLPGPAGHSNWVRLLAHGRQGGLTQLARRVIDGEVSTVLFFEDAETPREHDMDIQVLDRATQLSKAECLVLHDEQSAQRWAGAQERCLEPGALSSAVTLVQAFKETFDVDLVLAYPPFGPRKPPAPLSESDTWKLIVSCAATYFLEAVLAAVQRRVGVQPIRVGLSWGGAIRDVIDELGNDVSPGALGVREYVERWSSSERRKFGREEKWPPTVSDKFLATSGLVTGQDLRIVPMVGVMGSKERDVESHALVNSVADVLGGEATTYNEYAFKRSDQKGAPLEAIDSEWRQLDFALCSCDTVRNNLPHDVVGFPADLYKILKKTAVCELGHIYLERSGDGVRFANCEPYATTGIPPEYIREFVRSRSNSEVMLVAGAQEDRVPAAWAALRAGLVSTFITDPSFAWKVLGKQFPRRLQKG